VTILTASGDRYFDHVALPVDVFHFKSKHKEADEFFSLYYNLACWHKLIDESIGKWIINSSAAEQANLWSGGFHAMMHIMQVDRYARLSIL
jgi:hypothetical protein